MEEKNKEITLEDLMKSMNELNAKIENEIKSIKNELNAKIENEIKSVKNELEFINKKLELQELRMNSFKEVISLKSQNNTEYYGEYISEGTGLNSTRKKWVKNPFWG